MFWFTKGRSEQEEPAQVSRSALLPPAEAPDQPFTGSLGYGGPRDPFCTLTSRRSTKHYHPVWPPVLVLKPEEREMDGESVPSAGTMPTQPGPLTALLMEQQTLKDALNGSLCAGLWHKWTGGKGTSSEDTGLGLLCRF